jgi:hypothetical protein
MYPWQKAAMAMSKEEIRSITLTDRLRLSCDDELIWKKNMTQSFFFTGIALLNLMT